MPQDRISQLNELRYAFPLTNTLRETASDVLLEVRHVIGLDGARSYSLTLLVDVPHNFPTVAPSVTLPYCLYKVPITNSDRVVPDEQEWNPEKLSLTMCMQNAFQNLITYCGPVIPPTMSSVAERLSHETDRLLEDLMSNPNGLEAYCHQLPVAKQIREVSIQTVNEVESLANLNLSLRDEVETLNKEVKALQTRLFEQLSELQKLDQSKLITSICTPEGLIQVLERDLRSLHQEKRDFGKMVLNAYGSNREDFEKAFENYKAKARKMYEIDLKLRAYRTSLS